MKEITAVLDLNGCKNLYDLHQRIKKSLDFPDYYGENWDAFWDCINCDCPVTFLTVKGEGNVSEELKPYIEIMNEILEENKQARARGNLPFDYEIVD